MTPSTRRLLLINPNTSEAVTQRLHSHLQPLVPAGVELLACTAAFGAPYIACEASHAVAAHAVLQAWASQGAGCHGVLIGCFGDPGLFALREQAGVPVTGLAEAAFMEASQDGPYAIVTGGSRWGPMLRRLAQSLGFDSALSGIETVEPSGAQMLADPALAHEHLSRACAVAVSGGARSIIVGGAGLAGWAARLQPSLPGVRLIDSVEAGLRQVLAVSNSRPDEPGPDVHRPGDPRPDTPRPNTLRPDMVHWFPTLVQHRAPARDPS